jgi:hypothetical protein
MGLLDEAIREHLDLKRRRGADPAEVARQEQEALGPVRRTEPVPPPAVEGTGEVPAVADDPSGPGEFRDPEEDLVGPEQDEPQIAVPFEPVDETGERSASREEGLPGEGPVAADDDVLDQTPDFLQETPEHDRLWFEQRPPRNFDFDD